MIKAPGFDPTLNFDWTDKTPRCVSMLTAAPERTVVWKFNHKNHFKVISQHVYAWGKKFNYYYQLFFSPFFSILQSQRYKKLRWETDFFIFIFSSLSSHPQEVWRKTDLARLQQSHLINTRPTVPYCSLLGMMSLRAETCTSSMSTVINVGQCTVHLFSFLCKNSEAGTSQI